MQVGRWGNSLAIRIPAAVADALQLQEGDEVEVGVAGSRNFTIARDPAREAAVARLKALNWPLPPGFKFNRDEANERGE